MERSWVGRPSGLSEGDVSEIARSSDVIGSEETLESGDLPLMDGLARGRKVLREGQAGSEGVRAREQVDENRGDLDDETDRSRQPSAADKT